MVNILNKIREQKNKFLTTMVIIIISATMVNYAVYNILDIYFNTVDSVYTGVQINMIFTIVVIGIVTVLMLILLPRKSVDEMFSEISGENGKNNNPSSSSLTPAQQLQDMIDDENEKYKRKEDLLD